MKVWEELDLLGPAFIEFDSRNGGIFQFVAVSGDIDYRVSTEHDQVMVEWSWLGDDDGEETGGRGWAFAMATTSWDISTYIEAMTPLSSPRQKVCGVPRQNVRKDEGGYRQTRASY